MAGGRRDPLCSCTYSQVVNALQMVKASSFALHSLLIIPSIYKLCFTENGQAVKDLGKSSLLSGVRRTVELSQLVVTFYLRGLK